MEKMYSDEDLVMSVFSLFGAGTVTTSNTLVFFILVLAKFPHIQGKGSKTWPFPAQCRQGAGRAPAHAGRDQNCPKTWCGHPK